MDSVQLSRDVNTVFEEVISTISGITEQDFNRVPFPGSWTIGQVADHIVICSRGIPDSQVEDTERSVNEKEADLKAIFGDMEQKAEAAPSVQPQLPPHSKDALLQKLKANQMLLAKTISGKDLAQLCLDMEFPFMGYLTRYEWLRFVQVHTQRHFNQIKNIQQHLNHKL